MSRTYDFHMTARPFKEEDLSDFLDWMENTMCMSEPRGMDFHDYSVIDGALFLNGTIPLGGGQGTDEAHAKIAAYLIGATIHSYWHDTGYYENEHTTVGVKK